MALDSKKKIQIVKDALSGAKEAAGNYIYAAGLRRRQNKMIRNYVENKPTNLSPENRSQNNVINEMEKNDKKIKDMLRKKGLYK
jgi:hypothetical protein